MIKFYGDSLDSIIERARKIHEWELAEIKHQSHFIPYGVDWRTYFDHYPFDYLFSIGASNISINSS